MDTSSFKEIATISIVSFKDKTILLLPKLMTAAIIILLGIAVAYIFRFILNRVIKKIISSLADNNKIAVSFDVLRAEQSASLFCNIFYWVTIIFFTTVATEILGLSVVTAWFSGITTYLPKIFIAVLIGFGGLLMGSFIRNAVTTALRTAGFSYGALLGRILQYIIILLTLLICIDQVGVEITLLTNIISLTVAALFFTVSLSFGLGAKTSVSNILGAYYLQKQYSVGNSIRIGDTEGQIVRITPVTVIVETDEGQVSVPAKLFNESLSVLSNKES